MGSEPTRVMVAVNDSAIKGYPNPSISCKRAFQWTLEKIIRSNTSDFKILLIHVQVVDEDGFDEVDSVYASPEDFKEMRESNKAKGLSKHPRYPPLVMFDNNSCVKTCCRLSVRLGFGSALVTALVFGCFSSCDAAIELESLSCITMVILLVQCFTPRVNLVSTMFCVC